MHMDDAMAGTPQSISLLEHAAKRGLKGFFFSYDAFARHDYPWPLDDAKLDPLWDRLQALHLIFCAEINGAPVYDKATYISNMLAFAKVLDRFPGIIVHLNMGIPVQYLSAGDRWDIPVALEALYKRENFFIEIMFPITWGGKWDYPYVEARPLIRDLRDRFGAEKLLWGSDMPNVER